MSKRSQAGQESVGWKGGGIAKSPVPPECEVAENDK